MNYQTTELDHGYITRWLLSSIRKEEVKADPVVIGEESNVWIGSVAASSHENPIRTSFLEKVKEDGIPCPILEDFQPGGTLVLKDTRLSLGYRFPFGDPVIGASGFFSTPLYISVAAATILECDEDGDFDVDVSVAGGLSVFVDGNHSFSFSPYKRNESQRAVFKITLKKGKNTVIAVMDEFAERDTECTASLRLISAGGTIRQMIPIGNRDSDAITKVEKAVESLAFTKSTFTAGNVTMYAENPYDDKPFKISLEGATEENTFLHLLHKCEAVFPAGKNIADLGPVENFPVGFLRFNVCVAVENMEVRTIRTFENFPYSFLDAPLPTVAERKMQAFSYLAKYGEQNANRAMALLYTNGDKGEIETILRRQIDFINRRSDCSDFYLSYFPFMIRHFSSSGLIEENTLAAMKECILNFRYWHDEPGDDAMWFWSENHALMFHVCQLISGELYPDEVFTNSGMTGIEMQKKAKGMLREWFETFFSCGFTEWNSPPYLPIDSLGFASLYAQTEDEEMKNYARRALDYMFRLLAITSYEGVFSTTSGRTYLKELMGNHSNCPSFINWIGYGIGNQSHAGKGSVPICFSQYEPRKENLSFHRIAKKHALLWKSTHGYDGYADVSVYKTSSYLMSAANSFNPGRRGFQEDVFHLVMGADEHIWVNHPGEFALYGQARPSYWAGSGTLPQVNHHKGFASIVFKIDALHPVDFTHVYFPEFEFKKVAYQGNWAFAETHSGALVAIWAMNGLKKEIHGPNMNRELKSEGKKNVYFIRASELYKEGCLDEFIKKMMDLQFSVDSDSLDWNFLDYEYGLISSGWKKDLMVNGEIDSCKGYTPEGSVWLE